MNTLLESPSSLPGPKAGAVKCVETGQIFPKCEDAAEWLSSVGVQIQAASVRNCARNGTTGGGFHWRWVFDQQKMGLKKPVGRPPKARVPAVKVIPRTPVCCPDTGECYRDAMVAAEVMRSMGLPAEALGIAQAVMSGERYAGRFWDWRARHLDQCGTETETGRKCPECAERAGKVLAVEVPAAV